MQEIIEEILQTEAQCAERLAAEQAAAAARRTEAEAEALALVRSAREQCEREVAQRVAEIGRNADESIANEAEKQKREKEERIQSFRCELDRIVDRIVRIVAEA